LSPNKLRNRWRCGAHDTTPASFVTDDLSQSRLGDFGWGVRDVSFGRFFDYEMRSPHLCVPKTLSELMPSERACHPARRRGLRTRKHVRGTCPVCTENLIRVDDLMESPKLAE
jgi:hypothetical protein